MSRKLVLAGVLTAAWAASLALAHMLLAPAAGAAAVLQLNASNASYLASMSLLAGANMAPLVITGLFGLALYFVTRSGK
jgi:hypothetical protein